MYNFSVLTTMLANKTAWIGNLVAIVAIFITVIVFVASYATYVSTKDRAKKEARSVAKKWFTAKTHSLEQEIEKLLAKAEAAQESIAIQAHQVLFEAQDVSKTMQAAKAQAEAFMQSSHAKDPTGSAENSGDSNAASEFVQQANENLKSKAEIDFTADEHYIRGAALYHSGNLQAALHSFDTAVSHAGSAPSSDQVKYRMAKAFTLDALKRDEEANAIYDELDQQFGLDPDSRVREQVAIGLFNKGISLGELGMFEEAINIYDYLDYRYGEDTAPAVREQVAKGLFNKGFKLGKLGRFEDEIATYDDLDNRFGKDQSANVRSHMVKALNRLGLGKVVQAKSHWLDRSLQQTEIKGALAAFERALNHCVAPESLLVRTDQIDRAEVLGYTAYCLFLAGERKAAHEPALAGLTLGGDELRSTLAALLAEHRVEPEDSDFQAMLDSLVN
jgi:tetratricopeptide (TPR) repeat protein